MKDMEIKTENRYEYRKTQEKRKQMIAPDLFEFAYVPDWYGHLAELERLALPESWRFRKPSRETKNTETPILERYIHTIFRKQVIQSLLMLELYIRFKGRSEKSFCFPVCMEVKMGVILLTEHRIL